MNDYGMYENEAMVEKVTWGPPPLKMYTQKCTYKA